MKNWRPDGWAITKKKNCDRRLKAVGGADCKHCPAEPQTCNVDYEAGADAMHKADVEWLEKETARNYKGVIGNPNILIIQVDKDRWQTFKEAKE